MKNKIELIDKSAIIAEIKKRVNEYPCDNSEQDIGYHCALYEMEDFINSLKVKEVDLEKEYEEFVVDDPIFGNFITNDIMGMELAKHFFELGLKVQKGE